MIPIASATPRLLVIESARRWLASITTNTSGAPLDFPGRNQSRRGFNPRPEAVAAVASSWSRIACNLHAVRSPMTIERVVFVMKGGVVYRNVSGR
jgi:hypothetical protein